MLKDELSSFADADTADERVVTGQLPTRLRLLCVAPSEPSWVGLTLQLDAEGCSSRSFAGSRPPMKR